MPLILEQEATAIGLGRQTTFVASGGTAPYTYSLVAGGAGGSINPSTGVYTAPNNPTEFKSFQEILVTDDDSATATAYLVLGRPIILFCEILQREMELDRDRVYLWDQKLKSPTDSGIFIAVSNPIVKPYSNIRRWDGGEEETQQQLNVMAVVDVDIISRDISAFFRKEEVLLALNSQYSLQQQENYGFSIAKLPVYPMFKNLNEIDGAAIPYRYRISVNLNYAYAKAKDTDFFDTFEAVEITTEA